jgi:hypothetical protein
MLTDKPEIWKTMSHIFGTSNGKVVDHMSSTDAVRGNGLIVPKLNADNTNIGRCGINFNFGNEIKIIYSTGISWEGVEPEKAKFIF